MDNEKSRPVCLHTQYATPINKLAKFHLGALNVNFKIITLRRMSAYTLCSDWSKGSSGKSTSSAVRQSFSQSVKGDLDRFVQEFIVGREQLFHVEKGQDNEILLRDVLGVQNVFQIPRITVYGCYTKLSSILLNGVSASYSSRRLRFS